MIKTKTQIVTKTEEVVEDIICNKCGKSAMKSWGKEADDDKCFIGTYIDYSTRYQSYALPDGETYLFHLCEGYLAKLIDSLKIKPDRKSYWPNW